jgi:hypothetical protein
MTETLQAWLVEGGPVMGLLFGMGVVMVWLVFERWRLLRRWERRGPAAPPMPVLAWLDGPDPRPARLRRLGRWTGTLVLLAPLVGLLGTVSGMIEVFGSLAGAAGPGTGLAGGIGRALFTTQYGLVLAIPGTLVHRALDRRLDRLGRERTRPAEGGAP